ACGGAVPGRPGGGGDRVRGAGRDRAAGSEEAGRVLLGVASGFRSARPVRLHADRDHGQPLPDAEPRPLDRGALPPGGDHLPAALVLLGGMISGRRHPRLIAQFGGLWTAVPTFAVCLLLAMLASVGLPGLNGFVGEFLILCGAFGSWPWATAIATSGVILGAL